MTYNNQIAPPELEHISPGKTSARVYGPCYSPSDFGGPRAFFTYIKNYAYVI